MTVDRDAEHDAFLARRRQRAAALDRAMPAQLHANVERYRKEGKLADELHTRWAISRIEQLETVIRVYRMTLKSIAEDEALECACGSPPYTDGATCARCTAIVMLEKLKE